MQRIERYGVIALVFLLVTILAVALWGQRKNQSLMSFLRRGQKTDAPLANAPGTGATPIGVPLAENSAPNRELALTTPPVEGAPGTQSVPPGSSALTSDPRLALAAPAGPSPQAVTFGPAQTPAAPTGAEGFVGGPVNPLNPGLVVEGGSPAITPYTQPATASMREYKVKRGDTLGAIARRELGSANRWQEIASLNGGLDPQRVREGMLLKLPAGSGNVAKRSTSTAPKAKPAATAKAPAASGETYTIHSGDTLSEIARKTLGSAGRWREIAALNPNVDPSRLNVGTRLKLPAGRVLPAKQKPAKDDGVEVARATPKKAKVR